MSGNHATDDVVELAVEQWGLVSSRQARLAYSITPQQLKRLADRGVLERLHHGIYRLARFSDDKHLQVRLAWFALDPARTTWERLDEDVPTGVVSHSSAADMLSLGDMGANMVELSAERRIRLSIPDVTIHRSRLSRDDWHVIDGLPVTTPRRTITDLAAAGIDAGHLASIVRDALARDLASTEEIAQALAPYAFDYGLRARDGDGLVDEFVAQAGVPETTLTLADIARRHSSPLNLGGHLENQLMSSSAAATQLTQALRPAIDQMIASGALSGINKALADLPRTAIGPDTASLIPAQSLRAAVESIYARQNSSLLQQAQAVDALGSAHEDEDGKQ